MRLRLKSWLERLRGGPKTETPKTETGTPRPGDALEHHGLPDTTLSKVVVEYDPSIDGDPDPGEVVWTWVPFEEDVTQGKDRPVIVIGRTGDYLAGVALTTKGEHRPENVSIGVGPWDPSGRESFAKLDRVLRIDPAQVRREGAVLDRTRFERVIAGLRAQPGH